MNSEVNTYFVLQNNYRVTKSGKVVQNGGDFYCTYNSWGKIKISKEFIQKLVKAGMDCHQIETECRKIDETFTLTGSSIIKKGSKFGNMICVEDIDGGKNYDEDSESLVDEFQTLFRAYEEQINSLFETQEKIKELSKKMLSKKKKK